MSFHALFSGSPFRGPETKVSKAGKSYVAATIVSKDGASLTFANLVAFSAPVQDELRGLQAGDRLSVQGSATIGVYEKNGESGPSISIVADHVLALRQPKPKQDDTGWTRRQEGRRHDRPTPGRIFECAPGCDGNAPRSGEGELSCWEEAVRCLAWPGAVDQGNINQAFAARRWS
jgi:hypothetical protein